MNSPMTKEKGNCSVDGVLIEMLSLLEKENEALRRGDALAVADLSEEKLSLLLSLEERTKDFNDCKQEIKALAKQVKALSDINHMLIEHLNQHYTGLLSLILRLSGDTQIYSSDGNLNAKGKAFRSSKGTQIIA